MVDNQASPDLGALLEAAFADDESAAPPVEVVADEPVVEQVDGEQAEDVTIPAKLSDLFGQDSEESPKPAVDLAQEIGLPDGSKVSVQQLLEERLMRKDYTQKTQALSEKEKQLEAASELLTLLKEDPEGTIASLTAQVGLDPNEAFNYVARPSTKKNVSKILQKDDGVKQLIAEEAKKLFDQWRQDDPVMQQTAAQVSLSKANAELARIAKAYNASLDEADRNAIIKVAIQQNEPNLEYVFLKLKAALEAKQKEAERIKGAVPKRTAGTPQPTAADAKKVRPASIEEAWAMAQLEFANR